MAQPQPTPNHHDHDDKNCGGGGISESIVELYNRIESYHRPKKLYGRDQDLETISTVYHRFIDQLRQYDDTKDVNSSEFILVHGETGSGKSALIQHFFMNTECCFLRCIYIICSSSQRT
jgi:transcriptional regulator with PAS, ATPase and Fis domain